MLKKAFIAVGALFLATTTYGAFNEVQCSSDAAFGQYSCGQCFDGGEIAEWSNLAYLDDVWHNDTDLRKIAFKEEQTLPELYPLNGAEFNKEPNSDAFWQYTSEFEALDNDQFYGYVLPAGKSVSWIQSSDGASYAVNKVPAKGQNAWIMVYDLMSHNILANDEIATKDAPHRECVLYKSAQAYVPPVAPAPQPEPTPVPEKMTEVPTGPETYFLVLIAIVATALVWGRQYMLKKWE